MIKVKILVADDHPIVCDGLRLILDSQPDMEVVGEATTGYEVLRQAQQLQPDIIIIDIAMPGLNGIEATQQLQVQHRDIKVIILSMYSTLQHIFRALNAGAVSYLLKEMASTEIVQAIHAVQVGQRYLSPPIRNYVESKAFDHKQFDKIVDPLSRLSTHEREVLQYMVEGKSNPQIAHNLSVSTETVETYRSCLMHKLGIKDMATLVKFAIIQGGASLEVTEPKLFTDRIG